MDRTPMENALSTDVVMDIVMSHLKVRDLLNCRKISKFWNTAASSLLRKRLTMIKTISSEAELMELTKCMKQNSDFPFAGFKFDQSWMLKCPRAEQFFENYGEKFTSLYVVTSREIRIQDLAPFLSHLRRLSILEMHWSPHRAELLDFAAEQQGGRILNLPSLRTYVFQGSQGHKFPALQELKIHCLFEHMLSDGLFVVPSAKRIDLLSSFSEAGIKKLARSFPNVIEIQLDLFLQDFGCMKDRGPLDIWSVGAFKFLEKLVIRRCNVKWPTKSYVNTETLIDFKKFKIMNMDSFLTGIPIEICEYLRKHSQQNLKDSPFNEILRGSPNILQLKNLKQLIVSVELDSEDKWEELPEEPPFISMVSFWYALEMMPNLEARFLYEPLTVEFGEEERDKAFTVLRSAFKHVQPYVELKPFFC